LVYEGEQEGSSFVAERLIGSAAKTLFLQTFPKIEKLKHEDENDPYDPLLAWFFEESSFELYDDAKNKEYADALNKVSPLEDLISSYASETDAKDALFLKEFILWALVEFEKLNKKRIDNGVAFKDGYSAYLSGLS